MLWQNLLAALLRQGGRSEGPETGAEGLALVHPVLTRDLALPLHQGAAEAIRAGLILAHGLFLRGGQIAQIIQACTVHIW